MYEEHDDNTKGIPKSIDDILNARNQLDIVIQNEFTKDVSVVFTDICGYTKFMETRGDLAGRAMLQRHNNIVIPAITSLNGVVIKTIGDAVMAMFHKSSDAVAAAVEVQKGLYAHNQKVEDSDAIHVKIGLHHGKVLMDKSDIFGDAVNLAARIQALAGPDEIFLSQRVHDMACVPDRVDCAFLGAVKVKGKAEPQNIYRILWSDDQRNKSAPVQVRSRGKTGDTETKGAIESAADAVSSIHIDISLVDQCLTLSCFEQTAILMGTVRVYEEIQFNADHITNLCTIMVNTLNLVNRRGVFQSDCLDQLRQTGQELQISLLTRKIMDMLGKTRADHLVLLLDEALIHIPWELIHNGEYFLCRRFSIGRVIKTRQKIEIHQKRAIAKPLKALIIADPEKNLEGADKEGAALEDFFYSKHRDVNISRPREAMTSKFLLDHLHYYDWIHFAGHTRYDVDNPEMNGWCLSDQVVHARDIIAIAKNRPMPALVFSNACQSARDEAEKKIKAGFQHEIYSMANALLLSGVHHYVGTFWEIQDEYSCEFAMSCYNSLLQGNTIGRAVKDARQTFVEAHGEDAIVWASYLLYGDPQVCYLDQSADKYDAGTPETSDREDRAQASKSGAECSKGDKESANNRDEIKGRSADFDRDDKVAGHKPSFNSKSTTRLPVYLGILLFALVICGYLWHSDQKIVQLQAQMEAEFIQGDFDQAMSASKLLINANKKSAKAAAHLVQGKIHFQTGQMDRAKTDFQQVTDSQGCGDEQKADSLMGLGRIASAEKNSAEAIRLYEEASRYLPQGGAARIAHALVLTDLGRYEEALTIFDQTRSMGQEAFVPAALIRDIEQRVAIATDQEKKRQIKELVSSLSAKKDINDQIPSWDGWTSVPLTLWIMDFVTTGYAPREGQPQLLSAGLAEVLIDNTRARLVERAMLDKILEELHLGKSALISRDTALSIGKLMAARTMLTGQLIFSGSQLQVSLKLIETETGRIVLSVIHIFGALVAVSDIAHELGNELSRKIKLNYPLKAKIVDVAAERITINIGESVGVKSGDMFVFKQGEDGVKIDDVASNTSSGSPFHSKHGLFAGQLLHAVTE